MAGEDYFGTGTREGLDCGQGGTDAGVVGDCAAIEGHVKIDPHQDPLTLHLIQQVRHR